MTSTLTPAAELSRRKCSHNGYEIKRLALKPPTTCRLLSVRKSFGLSVSDVARSVGISRATVSLVENGRSPTLYVARVLAAFFGKTIEELWPSC